MNARTRPLPLATLLLLPLAGCVVRTGDGTMLGMLTSGVGGLVSLAILALDIYAIIRVWGSGASAGAKVLWTLVIVIMPVVGLILWALLGPRR